LAGSGRSPAARVIAWQKRHGRHDLPWQHTRDAYRIWLSEVMLQQTQVATVIPYYQRFLDNFPDVRMLARAHQDDVLALWSGLGYYSRVRNLHRAAQRVVLQHGGEFPRDPGALQALPGIGRSTAAAIAVAAHGGRHAILDGNVKRVLARYRGVRGFPGDTRVASRLWAEAEALLPRGRGIEAYTQGLMDLGNLVCTRRAPRCEACPLAADCVALAQGLTHVLPERKPRAAVPRRATVMLVIRAGARVLLEKRPERGVWGGLWSLPEVSRVQHATTHACLRGATVQEVRRLPAFTHAFTHFQLRITPLWVKVARTPARTPNTRWLDARAALGVALPTPVRKIIAHCF
jgi:A/G-specific adenine glycosylase